MKNEIFSYSAVVVQQTPNSTPFYLLSCKAEELLKWSDVPRKKEAFMAGYQRELSPRYETITEFFKEDSVNNIIPNAVIVAVKSNSISINNEGGKTTVSISLVGKDDLAAARELLDEFECRLSKEELDSIEIDESESSGEDENEDEGTPPESYMATIVKMMRPLRLDNGAEILNNNDTLTEYVRGASKPGLILDGQHRVWGAKNVSEYDVELPVVILPGLSSQEQVFHFYVLNNKAKPLNKTELRSIVSTSLSKKEIGNLYDRFKQAGVASAQADLTYRINNDDASPFKGFVDFGITKNSAGIIPENVAYQVVSKFMNLGSKYRMLTEKVNEWNSSSESDRINYRILIFYSFWSAVRVKYPNAWGSSGGSSKRQILQKVCLLKLQEFILDKLVAEMPRRNLKNEPSPLSDSNLIAQEVALALSFLTEEFFLKEWRAKGLDTAPGHALFLGELEKAFNNQSKNLGNLKLFRLQQ